MNDRSSGVSRRRFLDGAWALSSGGVTTIYLAGSVLWILLSDRVVETVVSSHEALAMAQTVKGLAFVAFSAVLILVLLRAGEYRREVVSARLRDSDRRFRTMCDSAPVLIWIGETPINRSFFNKGWTDFRGRTQEQEVGGGWMEGIHPLDLDRCKEVLSAAASNMVKFEFEYRLRRADGEYRWVLATAVPMRTATGEVEGFVGCCIDVTQSMIDRERQRLMMQELDHRVKNNLAAVLALAESTFSSTRSREDFKTAFSGRVLAMAQSHTALAKGRWGELEMAELVSTVLEPLAPVGRRRLDYEGMQLLLPPQIVPALAMTLHELGTNAIKHGAWSRAGGSVVLRWRVSKPEDAGTIATIEWREQGGPVVSHPAGEGLGSRLVKGFVESELGGDLVVNHHADGLHIRIKFDVDLWRMRHQSSPGFADAHVALEHA